MATKQQIPKIAAAIVEFQEEFASLATADGQWIIQHGKDAVSLCVKAVASRNETAVEDVKITKSISFGVVIERSNGKAFISEAKNIFNCLIDKAFDHYSLNEFSVSTPETIVDLYEISNGVSYYQMFNSITKDLNRLVVTQAQIINFCEKHPDWLAQKGRGIDFVIKAHDKFFVVTARSAGLGELCVDVMSVDEIFHEKVGNRQLIAVPIVFGLDSFLIDCDVDPSMPKGWNIEEHKKGGQLEFDPAKISLCLSKKQKKEGIVGDDLRRSLQKEPVLNANVLDYLLRNTELIPEDWKNKSVFFWGTIYRLPAGVLCVRCLKWDGFKWYRDSLWLSNSFSADCPAAVAI